MYKSKLVWLIWTSRIHSLTLPLSWMVPGFWKLRHKLHQEEKIQVEFGQRVIYSSRYSSSNRDDSMALSIAPAIVFIHVFDTNKATVLQRDGVPVSWRKEKNLFQRSPRCSAKALVHYGCPRTILTLPSQWDMAMVRPSSPTARGTNSIRIFVTENTSGANVRADLSTSYPSPTFSLEN